MHRTNRTFFFFPVKGKISMKYFFIIVVLVFTSVFLSFSRHAVGATAIGIADVPLESLLTPAPPNLMFGFDDSGSMDWETLTSNGVFYIGSSGYYYVFDNPGDDVYNSNHITGNNRLYWKSQFAEHNVMYYNPKIKYTPWNGFPDANVYKPRSHPYYDDYPTVRPKPYIINRPSDNYLDLSGSYTNVSNNSFIVDDGSASKSGYWYPNYTSSAYNGSIHYTFYNGSLTFTPNIPQAGNYQISVFWPCYTDPDRNAKIIINDNSGNPTDIYINQNIYSGNGICDTYHPLGSYDFAAGTSGSVSIKHHSGSTRYTIGDVVQFTELQFDIKNAHYYTWNDTDADDILDSGEDVYLVNLDGAIKYYKFTDDGDDKVEPGELSLTTTPPAGVVPPLDLTSLLTPYQQELQNFANWYSFYRKRRSTAVAAITRMIPKLKGTQVGIRSINGHIVQPVLSVDIAANISTLLNDFYSYHQASGSGSTPLIDGLYQIGRYYNRAQTQSDLGTSPLDTTSKGECQQNFTIMFTDGAYNLTPPNVGNVDGSYAEPYRDTVSNSLADVAMLYWETDLSALDDKVPDNFYDDATWQHMVTYTVAFGLEGNLTVSDYDLYNIDPAQRNYPTWSTSINTDKERVDDLWHAAINGRGKYLSAKNPQALIDAFDEVVNDVVSRIGSGASVSINGEELYAGSIVYQSRYTTDGWIGDVIAYDLDPNTGAPNLATPKWSASDKLNTAQSTAQSLSTCYRDPADPANDIITDCYWNKRIIATYSGTQGEPFRYANLSASQQALIDANQVDYLRGDSSKEGGTYRYRLLSTSGIVPTPPTLLGDIVHSAPHYHDDVLYVGANDGMLHAFDAINGRELFAYVPNLLFANLPNLTLSTSFAHKFYVDLTAVVVDIGAGLTPKNLLVGGLGKGGKGYYCLDVTDLDNTDSDPLSITTEAQLASKVLWECPAAADNDMGYSFSKPVLVYSNALPTPTHTYAGWVVIFGNGYNSVNGSAVLYVVDAVTGDLLKKIRTNPTGTGTSFKNGLSSPTPVDANMDSVVDYVYAGDLMGNMWKFDLTNADYNQWDVAYYDGITPKPLFQAEDLLGTPQPITTKPDVMYHCTKHGYMVIFGTGKYLGAEDITSTIIPAPVPQVQTVYGIWDYGDDADNKEYLGSFDRGSSSELSNQATSVKLLKQAVIFNSTYRVLSSESADWSTNIDTTVGQKPDPKVHAGWYFDLPDSGERVNSDVMIRGDKLIVSSIVPQLNSPCSTGGSSWLMELDTCSGARLSETPFKGSTIPSTISISDPYNTNLLIDVPITGIPFPSMIYPPVVINIPGSPEELKFLSTSAGGLSTVRETALGDGTYWIEVEE